MKPKLKKFIYDTLLKWEWIEPEKEDEKIYRIFTNLVNAYGYEHWSITRTVDLGILNLFDEDNDTFKTFEISLKNSDNYLLSALAYFAYFGIREKQGENVVEDSKSVMSNEEFFGMIKEQMEFAKENPTDWETEWKRPINQNNHLLKLMGGIIS